MGEITLRVNGVDHKVEAAAPNAPLLYILRNDLKLKGAKFGCGLGLCGACTVMIDGRRALSCDTPLWAAVGKEITTIEGVQDDGVPHAVQQAFIAEQAAQCGYCTSGMVMAAVALLRENPQPTRDMICEAMARNLCRCGAHQRVIRAIERAARDMQA
jgi:nicotinate dehydrogenase subunit A